MKTASFLWLLLISLIPVTLHAATWHVWQQEVPGVSNQTQTIQDAVQRARSGDIVLIHGGVYRESIEITHSGEPQKPILIQAAPAEHVILTGADRITDWQREEPDTPIFSTAWPHRFITWTKNNTHPSDDYHRVIGRCEQVFINGYALRQVLDRTQLSPGSFFVDGENHRLLVWAMHNADLSKGKDQVEASVRGRILLSQGDHLIFRNLVFRYAANMAQHGAVVIEGNHTTVDHCTFEYMNSSGATFKGDNHRIQHCTFQHNGQLGFGTNRSHNLRVRQCLVQYNNTKGFNRGWEAGANKITFSRGVSIEECIITENRGHGIWFDIGNEEATVRNCLLANNENCGIFYEISFGLHAQDNVIIGNGFADDAGGWGANSGISLSSSPHCTIENNYIVGNKEGIAFREQNRSTPLIDDKKSIPVWNHDHEITNNIIAYNRDAQVWGWFDINDNRHWPKNSKATLQTEQTRAKDDIAAAYVDAAANQPLHALSLEDLRINFHHNQYAVAPHQGLFHWGVTWKKNQRYASLDEVQKELGLEKNSVMLDAPGWPALNVPKTNPVYTKIPSMLGMMANSASQ